MNIAIIEDEIPAREQLIFLLHKINPVITIAFSAQSVKDAVSKFETCPELDLIFMDIQLNDGLSLEIFDHVKIETPVIFATAFDQYTLQAFQQNGIDYLLKPIKQKELKIALAKYQSLQHHFTRDLSRLATLLNGSEPNYRKRILVRRGGSYSSVVIDEVQYFFSEHKVTFLVNQEGQKLIVDETLSDLESSLNPKCFFRVNRAYLSSIGAIDKFSPDGKGKLQLVLNPPTKESVIVSQEKSGTFKEWYSGG
ncbi:MAG: LytTR family DNA-binding domain-containing protein [Marinoscillum sp.]